MRRMQEFEHLIQNKLFRQRDQIHFLLREGCGLDFAERNISAAAGNDVVVVMACGNDLLKS